MVKIEIFCQFGKGESEKMKLFLLITQHFLNLGIAVTFCHEGENLVYLVLYNIL